MYIPIEIAAVGLGVWWFSAYLAAHGRHTAWGLSFLLVPGVMTSLDRMLVDGLLTALFAGFLYYSDTGAWRKADAVIALACLARGTGLLLAGRAAMFWLLLRQRYRRAVLFATAVAPAL